MSDHHTPASTSIHDALIEAFPQVRCVQASKATLTTMSALIEQLAGEPPGRNVLVSVFQRGEYWTQSRDRYLDLANDADVVAVYSGLEPDADWDESHVGVRLDEELTRDWVVLALGPELAVTLCGREAPGEPPENPSHVDDEDDDDRLFEVIWSYDPDVARHAVELVLTALEEHAPRSLHASRAAKTLAAIGPPDVPAVARAADRLTTELLARVESLRRAERRADRRASQAKTAFLSRMGHELRNPLNAIMGYAQLLELGADEDEDTAQRIRRAGEHLLSLVDEVLDISQVETGELDVDLQTLDVASLALGALELIRTEATTREVRLEAEDALDSPLLVRADRRLVVEILLNLLSNAVKFNRPGGVVRITAGRRGEDCLIAVSDTGPGVPDGELERIFEPFERLPGTAHLAAGAGLGLSLSRTMAIAMDGRIDVNSPAGQDTTFTLILPLAD